MNGSATTIYGDLPEADIDLEWSGATARNAQVIYVNSTDPNGFGVWDSWYYAVDQNVAPVITMSYTTPCELAEAGDGSGEGYFSGDETELAMANSEGITFMNSSGDSGAAECDYGSNLATYGYAVAYPASSQYVTGVGGTSIPIINGVGNEYGSTYWNSSNGSDGGSAKGYIPEQPWNDAQEFGLFCAGNPIEFCVGNGISDWASAQNVVGISSGGGGVSNCETIDDNFDCTGGFPQPSWQSGISMNVVNPGGGGLTTNPARMTPDVSLLASPNFPGYLVCTQVNGTSGGSSCASGIPSMLGACFGGPGACTIFGGTSVSSPVFAGMVTLLNQYVVANGFQTTPGLGNINPTLYSVAAANSTNHAFNPVTTDSSGSYSDGAFCSNLNDGNQPPALQCPGTGFLGFNDYDADPTTSYNLVTGLGSVDLTNLTTAVGVLLTPTFTFSKTGGDPQTVTAGETTGDYTFTVTPTSGSTFTQNVTFSCSFSPTDPTLTNSKCTFTPSSIAAGQAATNVSMTITTAGPGPADTTPGHTRRSENRMPWLPLTMPIAGILVAGFAGRKVWRHSAAVGLCLSVVMLGLLVACGGGGGGSSNTGPPAISVSVSGTPTSLYPQNPGWNNSTAAFTATVNNDSSGKGVTWSVSPTLTGQSITATDTTHATYTPPTIASGLPSTVSIKATSVADTSKSRSATETLTPATVPNDYTVTVTAQESVTQQSQQVTLTVQ